MGRNRDFAYREQHTMTCTAQLCADTVSQTLQRTYGDQRHVPKRMSVFFDPRAWKNWYYGVNAPRMHDLIVLMANCDALKQEIDALVEAEKARIK